MNRTMLKPQDIMIGDWLMAEGRDKLKTNY